MPVYTPILATLGYVLSPDRSRVLLIHRNTRPDTDPAYGKYNGLGGKLEPDEDVAAGMRRELREEAGIEATRMTLRGTVSWPGFGKNGEDWFGFLFVISEWTGEALTANPEGTLEWVPLATLTGLELNLWPGDRFFLPLVFDDDPTPFHGVMPYKDGQPVRWSVSR
jgi:8-oxo-dGTP diphosphatase